jgi:RNA polymerase sigma-70 factor (ECF subfamily)
MEIPHRGIPHQIRAVLFVTFGVIRGFPNGMNEARPMRDPQETSGNGRQLQEFVRELTASQGRMRAFIVALMPGSPDVGDVLQETNLVLWNSRARFKPGTNFVAWAFTIARLEVLHHRRRTQRQGRVLISVALQQKLADETPLASNHEIYLNALEECISKLSETQRDLIENRYEPGRSLEDHARQTGRKAPALRIALMRIRSLLRGCIEESINEQLA